MPPDMPAGSTPLPDFPWDLGANLAGQTGLEPGGDVVYLPEPRPSRALAALKKLIASPNIAEDLDEELLARIGRKVVEEFEIDLQSREDEGWTRRNEAALRLAMQVKEAKTYPWANASNIKYPLIATAAIQFNARAYPAIVDGPGVVKGKVLGRPSEEKRARAERVARHMSYQLLEEMDGWEEDTDRLLVMLPITGTVFRKSWFNPAKGKNDSEIVTPEKLVVNYWAKPLDACPRVTQVCEYYPHEAAERFRSGAWREIELGRAADAGADDEAPHDFLEQHRLWDLDEDGYPEPYVVTVHRETGRVARITARFDEDGIRLDGKGEVVAIRPVQYFTKYGFIPSMDGSFYDIGFGALLDALNETINSTMNQLMDAGHLANVQGGFIGATGLKGGALSFKPGEWKRVEAAGPDLRAAIVPLPVKEPSGVLFNLLGLLVEAAKDITATKDILTGDAAGANTPVGTTLAMIEQGLKVFTAIYKRVHRALKQELAALARLNRLYLEDQAYFVFQDEEGVVARADYEAGDCDIVPVSDPTVVTDTQKVGRAQFLMQFLGKGLDDKQIITRVLEAASIPDVAGLFPEQGQPDPAAMMAGAKLEIEKKKLEQRDRELEREEALAIAEIGRADAAAQKAAAETALIGGDLEAIAAFIDQRVGAILDAALQQREPGGMEGLAADGGVPGLPEGPAAEPGGAMGAGGGAFPGMPDEGAAAGGAVGA